MDRISTLYRLTATGLLLGAAGGVAVAQDVSLNYDGLSSLEAPLGKEVGDVTFVLRGRFEAPVKANLDPDEDTDVDAAFVTDFEINAETQLANRWTVGAVYFGKYDSDGITEGDVLRSQRRGATLPGTASTDPSNGTLDGLVSGQATGEEYQDRGAVYVSGAWGTVLAGNVTGQVREETRRAQGAGNSALAFDDFYGGLTETGGGFTGRFGPTRLSAVVDEDGDFELGAVFQRPLGNKDYRFSGRYAEGKTFAADGLTHIETRGIAATGELVYGSSRFDLTLGAEELAADQFDVDRWFASLGAARKLLGLSMSAAAHYGEVDGDAEVSAALGAGLDIARGLSLNLGLNYQDADVKVGDIILMDIDAAEAVASVRYIY